MRPEERKSPAIVLRVALLVVAGLAVNLTPIIARQLPAGKRSELRWQAHTVAKIPSGYQVAVADMNGDGCLDIVAIGAAKGNVV